MRGKVEKREKICYPETKKGKRNGKKNWIYNR